MRPLHGDPGRSVGVGGRGRVLPPRSAGLFMQNLKAQILKPLPLHAPGRPFRCSQEVLLRCLGLLWGRDSRGSFAHEVSTLLLARAAAWCWRIRRRRLGIQGTAICSGSEDSPAAGMSASWR